MNVIPVDSPLFHVITVLVFIFTAGCFAYGLIDLAKEEREMLSQQEEIELEGEHAA